jgi:hypothetical protein
MLRAILRSNRLKRMGVGSVDVYVLARNCVLQERPISTTDRQLVIEFDIDPTPERMDFEFRVHTAGISAFILTSVLVVPASAPDVAE